MASFGDASKRHAMSSTQANGSIVMVSVKDSVVENVFVPLRLMMGDNSSWRKMALVVSNTSAIKKLKTRLSKISSGLALFR